MSNLRVYGVQDGSNNRFVFPLIGSDNQFTSAATFAAGDCQIYKITVTGGTATWVNTNSLPVSIGDGFYYVLLDGADEMEFAIGIIKIIDATVSSVWLDQGLEIHTVAHANALHHGAAGVT